VESFVDFWTRLQIVWPQLQAGALVTIQVSALGIVFSLILAFAGGLGRLAPWRPVRWISGAYIEVFRGTSMLVQMFWFFFAFPQLFNIELSPMTAGVLALGMNVGSYGSEVVRGAILAVPKAQSEAAVALNFSGYDRMRRVIVPQAVVAMLPPFGNLAIELLKGSALVSLITVADLAFRANQVRIGGQLSSLEIFSVILVIYFVIAYAFTLFMRAVERRATRGLGMVRGGRMREPAA
jgi:polar amino acid transport system permease protein